MLFGRKKRTPEKEQNRYWECTSVWYFRIEYHYETDIHTSFEYFNSLQDAEYWYKTTAYVTLLALTDRQGNRIITDWTGFNGADTIKSWNDMGRQVLDLRSGHNDLWVPLDSKRAKGAKKVELTRM